MYEFRKLLRDISLTLVIFMLFMGLVLMAMDAFASWQCERHADAIGHEANYVSFTGCYTRKVSV